MDIYNLGSECYKKFSREKILSALSEIDEFHFFKRTRLEKSEAEKAMKRALFRLNTFYNHLNGLLYGISGSEQKDVLSEFNNLRENDTLKLKKIYKHLGEEKNLKEEGKPGIALFLVVAGQSFALLSEINIADNMYELLEPVYMSTEWKKTINKIFGKNGERGELYYLLDRIIRCNRIWQKERWSVLPGSDYSAEPFSRNQINRESQIPPAIFFNNIMNHTDYIDGWVDAFWGVQSGIRIPIPVGDDKDSAIVILLTSFIPDAFPEKWSKIKEKDEKRYIWSLRDDVYENLKKELEPIFQKEIENLIFAVKLIKDMRKTQINLIEAAFELISHHYKVVQSSKKDWELEAQNLFLGLKQISGELYEEYSPFTEIKRYVYENLEKVSSKLPDNKASNNWTHRLTTAKAIFQKEMKRLLENGCNVKDLIEYIKRQSQRHHSKVFVQEDLSPLFLNKQFTINSFMLSAIIENLLEKQKVLVKISQSNHKEELNITAFYLEWQLPIEDDKDFLLNPIGQRTGFYFTADTLWRHRGKIEYYRIDDKKALPCYAIINLTIPLKG